MTKVFVSVAGMDRTGIIAAVAAALSEMNINILEISQTILDGCFTMMMVVDIQKADRDFTQIAQRLDETGQKLSMAIHIQRMDIFDAMHRV